MTGATAQTVALAIERALAATTAPRKHGVMTVVCIGAFIAWCALPEAIWGAQLGLSALSHHHPVEPQPLPSFCVRPDAETRLVLGGEAHEQHARYRAALFRR